MPVVQLSYSRLLVEIVDLLGIDNPRCEITIAAEGWFLSYIDLYVPRDDSILDIVRCWGVPFPKSIEFCD